jgi:uncharacterized protein YkwD
MQHKGAQKFRRRTPLWAVSLLAAAAASSSPAAAATLTCAHADSSPARLATTTARRSLLCLINQVRTSRGLPPLRRERHLRRAATAHAGDMAARDYFDHDGPDGTLVSRVRAAGYLRGAGRWRVGEAIAWGRGHQGTPGALVRGLMASPPHRALLLAPDFRDVGIGLAHGAPNGSSGNALVITLDFGRRD